MIADLSKLGKDEFWVLCDNKGWCHPYDADGVRRGMDAIPKTIASLSDDPYRSLAGELRPIQGGQERLREAAKHGFKRAIIPHANAPKESIGDLEIHTARSLSEVLDLLQNLVLTPALVAS